MMFDLSGRVALVTGAGQNVGAGIARALADRGAAVAVNDLHAERAERIAKAIEASGGRSVAAPFDVTSLEATQKGVAAAKAALGPIDVLVNNAGVPDGMGLTRFRDYDPAQWARMIDLNLYGVLHCTRAVVDDMCARGWGRIVTISSGAGQVGLPIGVSLYGAGKGGAIAFMRHLAIELARSGVTANTLALGLMSNAGDAAGTQAIAAQVPVGRLGTPEDVGAAVVYLASPEASWVTGQTIGLNGGSTTS
jgi:NAD(P)-dependent dehydrogenase (short-subunit alcohol dehydrogenase family)